MAVLLQNDMVNGVRKETSLSKSAPFAAPNVFTSRHTSRITPRAMTRLLGGYLNHQTRLETFQIQILGIQKAHLLHFGLLCGCW